MGCRRISLPAPLRLVAALAAVTGSYPDLWTSAAGGDSAGVSNACTKDGPDEIALNASVDDPLTFSCPSDSKLLPEGEKSRSTPTAYVFNGADCSQKVLLSELDLTAELSVAPRGEDKAAQVLTYQFSVTKLPSATTTLCYICEIPAPPQTEPEVSSGVSVASPLPAPEASSEKKECRVKISVPARQALTPTPTPPASSTAAPPAPSASSPPLSILASVAAFCVSLNLAKLNFH